MIHPRFAIGLTMFLYYMDNSYGGFLRAIGVAKWGGLGLVAVSAASTTSRARVPGDPLSAALIGIFALIACLAWATGMETFWTLEDTQGFPMRLVAFVTVMASSYRLARVWLASGGWPEFEGVLIGLARFVAFTSALMLPLGLSLGRGEGRFSGWTANPNTLGMILFLLAPAVLARALRKPSRGFRNERFLMFVLVVVVLATGSRGSALGLIVACGVYLWGVGRIRGSTIASGALVLCFLALFWSSIAPVIRSVPGLGRIVAEKNISVHTDESGELQFAGAGREAAWPLAWALISEQPMLGYGWDQEKLLIWRYHDDIKEHQGENFHNSFLSLLIQTGFMGAIPFVVLLFLQLSRGIRFVARERLSESRDRGRPVMLAMFAASLLHGIFESTLVSSGMCNAVPCWLAIFGTGVPAAASEGVKRSTTPMPIGATARDPVASG